MGTSNYLYVHPWLHPDESWAGFQVGASSGRPAPEALHQLLGQPGVQHMDARLPWFIPVATAADVRVADTLAAERTVLLLQPPEDPANQEAAEALEADLRRASRKLGIVLAPNDPLPPTGVWNYAVLSVGHARTLPPFTLIGLSTRTAIVLTQVGNRNDYGWAAGNQASLLSGEYLVTRQAPTNKPDVTRLKLLELLSLVVRDADTPELEAIFRQEPKLAYGLLRLVNSAAMAPRSPVTSFGQAIQLLGRRQLQRWLQLLVYANAENGNQPNPLLLQAATRGRLMEILIEQIPGAGEAERQPDAAFMTGTFSLLDVLLNLSMTDILQQLPLPGILHDALATHGGMMGELLAAIAAADLRDYRRADEILARLSLDSDTFGAAQASALEWASRIRSLG